MVQVQHPKAAHLASNGTMVCRKLQIKNKALADVRSKQRLMLMAHAKHICPQLDMHQTAEDCFHMNTCLLLDNTAACCFHKIGCNAGIICSVCLQMSTEFSK